VSVPPPLQDIPGDNTPMSPSSPASPATTTPHSALKSRRNADDRNGSDAQPAISLRAKSHAHFVDLDDEPDGFHGHEGEAGVMGTSSTSFYSSSSFQSETPTSTQDRSPSGFFSRMSFRRSTSALTGRSSTMGSTTTLENFQVSNAAKAKGLSGLISVAAATWFFMSSVLLVLFGIQYDGIVVDQDQARYASSAAERAAVNAAAVLDAGLAARDAVDYAIKSKLYFEPMDYAAVRAAVEPVFAGFPSLRAVDLAFTGREDFLTIRRLVNDGEAVGSFMSMDRIKINARSRVGYGAALAMQSSAADCTKLGERGCLSSANASSLRWHRLASGLWGGEESDGFKKPSDEVFRWDDHAGFVPRDPSRTGATKTVEWSSAYSLVFRTAFPGSSGKLSALGRSVMELSGLRKDNLLDDISLGTRGAIYIVDRAGALLAADQAGQQAFVQQNGGVFRFRYLSEIQAPWASKLQDFDGTPQSFYVDGFYVVVQPVRGRGLGNFSAVVAADRDVFVDSRLSPALTGAKVVAILPYPVFFLTLVMLQIYRDRSRRTSLRRVHVLHEGMATLEHMSDGLEPSQIKDLSKLRRKHQEQMVEVQREAASSMNNFLALSHAHNNDEAEQRLALVAKPNS